MESVIINFNVNSEQDLAENSIKAGYSLKYMQILVELNKPAQRVFVCLLQLLEECSDSKITMSQSAFGRKFDMNRDYVSKGIRELVSKNILIKKDESFYLNIE